MTLIRIDYICEMKIRWVLLLFSGLLLTNSCKTKVYSLQNLPKKYVCFGSGGGFTGLVSSYYLLPNGQMFFQTNFDTAATKLPNVNRKARKSVFKLLKEIKTADWMENKPDNIYQFIHYKTKDTMYSKMWYSGGPQPFFDTLSARLNNLIPKTNNNF